MQDDEVFGDNYELPTLLPPVDENPLPVPPLSSGLPVGRGESSFPEGEISGGTESDSNRAVPMGKGGTSGGDTGTGRRQQPSGMENEQEREVAVVDASRDGGSLDEDVQGDGNGLDNPPAPNIQGSAATDRGVLHLQPVQVPPTPASPQALPTLAPPTPEAPPTPPSLAPPISPTLEAPPTQVPPTEETRSSDGSTGREEWDERTKEGERTDESGGKELGSEFSPGTEGAGLDTRQQSGDAESGSIERDEAARHGTRTLPESGSRPQEFPSDVDSVEFAKSPDLGAKSDIVGVVDGERRDVTDDFAAETNTADAVNGVGGETEGGDVDEPGRAESAVDSSDGGASETSTESPEAGKIDPKTAAGTADTTSDSADVTADTVADSADTVADSADVVAAAGGCGELCEEEEEDDHLLTFEEFKKKMKEQEDEQVLQRPPVEDVGAGGAAGKRAALSNYASQDCGAKVVETNSGAKVRAVGIYQLGD